MNDNLTRSGIAYNLEISPHKLTISYGELNELTFVFSSNRYKEMFKNKMDDNRNKINDSLSNRFGFEIQNDKLCDLKLYSTIEKRGFLIKGKEDYKCLSTIKLDGHKLTIKN